MSAEGWRIEQNFSDAWGNMRKRQMRQDRRPVISSASQILGPGAAPFAVTINDWNEEAATFVGVYFSEPGAANSPDDEFYWMGETFGWANEDDERWGFQRLTRVRVPADTDGGVPTWTEYRRRFFTLPNSSLVSFTGWASA